MSNSIDSIGQLINQFGVAESGDGLAVLRFLGLEINAAMVNVLGADADELRRGIERLGERMQLRFHERLSPMGQLDLGNVMDVPQDDAYWTPQAWQSLAADLSSNGYALRSAEAATQVQLVATEYPDLKTTTVVSVLDAAALERLMSEELKGDWRSTMQQGQRVWRMDQKTEKGGIEYRLTEQRALVRASQAEVQALMNQIDDDTLAVLEDVVDTVRMVEISLREWAIDFLADERVFLRARQTDDRRVTSQEEEARQAFQLLMERARTREPGLGDLGSRLASEAAGQPAAQATVHGDEPMEPMASVEPAEAGLARLLGALERAARR
jgi:hypothetical protein